MSKSITADEIIKAMDEIVSHELKQPENPFGYKPMHFSGMPVYEVQDRVYPKLQLTESFADKWLTDEAKERINAKLVALLGVTVVKPIPEGVMYRYGNAIMARPGDVSRILNTCA